MITCSMCGLRFDPENHPTCDTCQVESGCQLVCCPACGYETVNVQESKLARWLSNIIPKLQKSRQQTGLTLADAKPGCWVKIIRYSAHVPPEKRARLQAYGLVGGHAVRVVQHSPVTVVRVEHTELALEKSLALEVQVEALKED